jgi:hypothetical protein
MAIKGIRKYGQRHATLQAGSVFPGFEPLGGLILASAAVTTGVLTIPARNQLIVVVTVTGYSGADIASLRFNADAGANYWSRYNGSTAAAGTTFVNNTNVSQTLARMFGATQTTSRSALVKINNQLAVSKAGCVSALSGSGTAATAGALEFGGFEWVNTTAQITTIEMRTAGGTLTLNAGSGFTVYGMNL